MKTKLSIIISVLLMCPVICISAQETARERIEQRRNSEASHQTTGEAANAGRINQMTDNPLQNAKWIRVIYRHLDLTKDANAPLYYPEAPIEGHSNLFTMLFKLFKDETIAVYEYLEGQEVFTSEYRLRFNDFIDRFDIYHETVDGHIVVNDADIPNNEVLAYFVKEAYYFDSNTTSFMVRPLAICPVLHRNENHGITRYPLFWVDYAELEQYARKMPVMGSSLNNSMSGTVNDFFLQRKYEGEIYKAQNPANLPISGYTSTPEEAQAERERIEQELIEFEKQLWSNELPSIEQSPQKSDRRSRRQNSTAPSPTSSTTMRDRRY